MLLANSLSNSDMSQSSKSKNLGNSEASWRDKHGNTPSSTKYQTKQECTFKFEEVKAQFINRVHSRSW